MVLPGDTTETLIERIYEAALIPDLWDDVLARLAAATASASGSILVFPKDHAPRYRTTELTQEALHHHTTTDEWRRSRRDPRILDAPPMGFVCMDDVLPPEQLERDSVQQALRRLGLGWQAGMINRMPADSTIVFTFERRIADGRHSPEVTALMEALRPHLLRAGMISTRLGLARAREAVATLEALGLAAMVLDGGGRQVAANAIASSGGVFRSAAFGRVALADGRANALFQAAVADATAGHHHAARSIGVRPVDEGPTAVVHVLPLRRDARELFAGAMALVVANRIGMGEGLPAAELLHAMFDLTPAESRLALALASGRTLKGASADLGIRITTARSYLESVFRKTGAAQQSQVVSLLKSVRRLG